MKDCKVKTNIISEDETRSEYHHFFPSLAIEIGLREGVNLEKSILEYITEDIEKKTKQGYLNWNETYPADYDDTIVARNILNIDSQLELSFNGEGGVYTYKGGLEVKTNNSVDLLVNVRILDYLKRIHPGSQNYARLKNFLIKNKEQFKRPINEISKYYLSEGFLLYCLSKVDDDIRIDINELSDIKREYITHPTDINLKDMAIKNKAVNRLNLEDIKPLELFWHPRKNIKFSCLYFDEIVSKR